MEIEIKEQKENKLLKRTEITGTIKWQGATPSNKDLQAELAKKLGTEFIEIKGIYTKFGQMQADFKAHVYKDAETLKATEPRKKIKEEKKE